MFESGVICANYGATPGHFPKCESAWFMGFFTPHELDCFSTNVARDFNGATLDELEVEQCFSAARPCDHLCTHFQCPNCQSQNIQGRGLVRNNARDKAFTALLIRATHDAFWAHASGMVRANITEVRFMVRYGAALGFDPMPPLGTFLLHQHKRMLQAIMLLMRSTEPG
jgi:hypothetical protein